MAVKVKDASMSAQKFSTRGAAAASDYAAGVSAAGDSWASATAGAADNYAAGVQAGIGRKAFQTGVQKAGPSKYVAAASGKGAQRYPQGVSQAGPAWQAGVAPYLSTIASLTLPPRRPKGDPANYARVQAVGQALRAKKAGGG